MLREVFIKIGSITIIISRRIFGKKENYQKNNTTNIKTETLKEIIKQNQENETKRKINPKYVTPTLFTITLLIISRNSQIILEILILIIIIILFKKNLPKIKEEKRRKEITQKLPYALRQMSTQLKAGIGLYDTMKTITESNYGALSEEFRITLKEIQYGNNYIDSFNKLSQRTKLKSMDKLISQIIRTLNNGGNLADTLNTLADENSYNMRLKYKEYSEKLNAIMLLYMFIAVLLPVISFILLVAATTVMGSIIKPELLLILYLIFFPMIIIFMIIFIKRLEPSLT
ncbi:type II secretion system F family protein [Methanosphaera sp. ISO3-F5]|uniref:type II secretion system F family protein n=1 Tax=Methanosphaera sp. ISO3-F5 TaxID=1452353 RepID=UPI002B25694E|nr:type II secretion system F family protein [Methanosphaera sp. ISO3-F5]WQH64556.1 type II secretion system F family protein [Methanosphaera sp. ISO3-F5]